MGSHRIPEFTEVYCWEETPTEFAEYTEVYCWEETPTEFAEYTEVYY